MSAEKKATLVLQIAKNEVTSFREIDKNSNNIVLNMAKDKTKKRRKSILATLIIGVVIGGAYGLYLWNMPHLDVQAQKADYFIESSVLVSEYLQNEKTANEKYLSNDGDSKIFIVKGKIKSKGVDMNNQTTVLLQEDNDKAGVNCVFTTLTNKNANQLNVGRSATIKGIIRSGAKYDNDLELYENVLLEKCDIASE